MTEFKTMKELPEHDRPYEKCVRLGPQALTDPELLAVVLEPVPEEALLWKWQKRY